jgi:hypothetical protein
MLVNEAGGNVSVLCPLEQPGGGFRYQGDGGIVAPGASRDAKYTKKGIIVNRVAIEYGQRWQLFYDSLDSKMVSPEQMEDLCGIVSRATRQFGLCDCTKESVEYFCNRLGWPQQLIDDVFDLFHKAFAAEASQLCHALSNRTVISLKQRKRKFGELSLASGESGGGKRRLRTNEPSTNRLKKKKSWRQSPRCWTQNIKKISPPEERSGVRAAIAEFQQLRRVSEEDMAFDNDLGDDLHEERTHSYQQPHDVSFESLAATAESLNIACGASTFSAAARILLHQNNFPLRAIWPEPAVVKPKPAAIDDTRPLGYEWHIDDKDRRVRRSLRIIYMKEQMADRGN